MLYFSFFHLYFSIFLPFISASTFTSTSTLILTSTSTLILTSTSTFTSTLTLISVLLRVSNYVRGKSLPSIFTFKKELVVNWLADAKVSDDCREIQEKKRKFVHEILRNYESLKGINFLAFFLTILPSYLPFNLFSVRISFPFPFHVTFLILFFRSFLLPFLLSCIPSFIPSFIPSLIPSFVHSFFHSFFHAFILSSFQVIFILLFFLTFPSPCNNNIFYHFSFSRLSALVHLVMRKKLITGAPHLIYMTPQLIGVSLISFSHGGRIMLKDEPNSKFFKMMLHIEIQI